MKMKLRRTNIAEKIHASRNSRIAEEDLLLQIKNIFEQESKREEDILATLGDDHYTGSNDFDIDQLEWHRIFHLSDIEKICIEYRLRFLNSSLYKAEFPYETIIKIKEVEKQHDTTLGGFMLMAPATVFKLKNADDPLLFAPIGNEYYYLIHSWGRDLHPFRKIMMWPFRHLENFMFFVLVMSLIVTSLIPAGMFGPDYSTTEFIVLFLFVFKWITGLAIFYGFKFGKNFSSAIWRSKFYNA